MAVMNFGVCDFSRFAVTDWRLRFLALMTATHSRAEPVVQGCKAATLT